MTADPGLAQLEAHTVDQLPRQPDGRPWFLDHRRVAASRCVADLLHVLGTPRGSYPADVLTRLTEAVLDTLPDMYAAEITDTTRA